MTILGGAVTGGLRALRDGAQRVGVTAPGDVEQQAHRPEQADEAGGARRDEGQRDARQRREAEDGVDVQQGLAQDE
jgi:hypothetical protein